MMDLLKSKNDRIKLVDLTLSIHPDMPLYDKYPKPVFLPWVTFDAAGFAAETLFFCSHTGTHVDAPSHYDANGKRIDDFSIAKFMGQAVVLDLSHMKSEQYIQADDIRKAEEKSAKIQNGDIVLLRLGWDKLAKSQNEYLTKNPGLSKESADYLVSKHASIVGVDSTNIDHPSERDPAYPTLRDPAHSILLKNDVLIIEALCKLDQLTKSRFWFVGLPLNLRGLTGSPIRAVGLLDE